VRNEGAFCVVLTFILSFQVFFFLVCLFCFLASFTFLRFFSFFAIPIPPYFPLHPLTPHIVRIYTYAYTYTLLFTSSLCPLFFILVDASAHYLPNVQCAFHSSFPLHFFLCFSLRFLSAFLTIVTAWTKKCRIPNQILSNPIPVQYIHTISKLST